METEGSVGLVGQVRGFLAELRRELPEIFALRLSTPCAPRSIPESGAAGVFAAGPTGDPVRDLFLARVKHWSAAMGVAPRRVFLKNQRTLWGSCSTRGNLNFNRVLADAPAEIVDYVVIHELAHLKEMNHSRRFWDVVEAWCPEQKQRRRWLRQNVSLLRRSA